MARTKSIPQDFGIEMEPDDFVDLLVDDFNSYTRGETTIDELLLHPHDAIAFCDAVRKKHGWHNVPDDAILRRVMSRRKNP
jgi:hypothetical protein